MQEMKARFCTYCGHTLTEGVGTCANCHVVLDERFRDGNRTPAEEAKQTLLASLSAQQSRRAFFKKGAIVAASGLAVASAGGIALSQFASAQAQQTQYHVNGAIQTGLSEKQKSNKSWKNAQDPIVSILTIARTAEQLAVTFYSNGVKNADKLGLSGTNLEYIKAALEEEQIHQKFFAANGGQSLADTFSFPNGPATFTDLKTFIETQQQLEGVFDSAFLAAIKEFAQLNRPDLAQIAGQVACVEAEHRVLGRAIAGLSPANNWVFTPVYLGSVADAPALVTKAGYLSPKQGNSYSYAESTVHVAGVEQTKPYAAKSTQGNG